MPIKIPQATREAMVDAALIQYQRAVEAATEQKPDRYWCEVVVNAAIDELEKSLNARAPGQSFAPAPEIGFTGMKIGSIDERGPTALGGPPEVLKKEAVARGFSGEACPKCLNFRMLRTGTCLTCQDCGFNKGCD